MPELQAIAGGRVGGRLGARLKGNPGGPPLAMPGDESFALVVLVLLELAALIWLRRTFRTAHGG
jgi:hypothetical protein